MQTQIIEFQATIQNGIVHIPKKYHYLKEKKFNIIITDVEKENKSWQYWSDTEIDNFGKIAIGLSKNDYDNEDFSKW